METFNNRGSKPGLDPRIEPTRVLSDGHLMVRYDSVSDALKDVKSRRDPASSSTAGTSDADWYGTPTFEAAVSLCQDGWHDARPKMDAVLVPLRERLSTVLDVVPTRALDITGYEPDIDLYLDGELECMVDDLFIEAPKTGKVFTMLVSASYDGGHLGDTILKRGAVIAALVEAFVILGYELEVYVEVSSTGYMDNNPLVWTMLTRAHSAGYNMDLDQLAFVIGHPSWLRRIVFGCMEGESDQVRKGLGATTSGGYGRPTPLQSAKLVNASMVVSLGSRDMYDTDPLQWVLNQLEAQGIYEPKEGL